MFCVVKYRKYELWVVFLLYMFTLEITSAQDSKLHNRNASLHSNECSCIHYDCSCCGHIEWDEIKLNTTICATASYLDKDYGVSLVLSWNGVTLINETISARNPPPLCIGEDIIDNLKAEVCLRLYDVEVESKFFHGCFELEMRFAKLNILPLKLGCFKTGHHNPSSSISLWSYALFPKHLYFFIWPIVVSNVMLY